MDGIMMPRSGRCVETFQAHNWCGICNKRTCRAVTRTITFENILGAQKDAWTPLREETLGHLE